MVLLLKFVRQAATASHETPHDSMLRILVVLNGTVVVGAEVKEGEHGAGRRARKKKESERTNLETGICLGYRT
jgi:hypothetical protein